MLRKNDVRATFKTAEIEIGKAAVVVIRKEKAKKSLDIVSNPKKIKKKNKCLS